MNVIEVSSVKRRKIWRRNSKSTTSLALPVRQFSLKTPWVLKPRAACLASSCTLMWSLMPFVMRKYSSSKWTITMFVRNLRALRLSRMKRSSVLQRTRKRSYTRCAFVKSRSIFWAILTRKRIEPILALKGLTPCLRSVVLMRRKRTMKLLKHCRPRLRMDPRVSLCALRLSSHLQPMKSRTLSVIF